MGLTSRYSTLSPLTKSLTQNKRSSIIRSTNERRMRSGGLNDDDG
jgi:hypothetical protein